jgi:hypothetical protein
MKWHNDQQVWAERADREKRNARKLAKYHENAEVSAARMREWRARNPERQKEIERRSREKNAEAIKQRNTEWRAKNEDRLIENSRAHFAQHRERANAGRAARRATNVALENQRQREYNYRARAVSPWLKLIMGAKTRAKKYNVPFDLTEEWAQKRWTGECELTRIPFRLDQRGSGPKVFSPSIDQVNPRKGYTKNNCRIVLWAINAFKHDGTDEDMYLIAAALMDTKFSNDFKDLKCIPAQVVSPKA